MYQRLARFAFWVTLITLISKMSGFLRDIILAASFGARLETDAYVMAQSVLTLVTVLLTGAIGTTFIPVMADRMKNASQDETNHFVRNTYSLSILIVLLISTVLLTFTRPVVTIFAPQFTASASDLTVTMTRILLPTSLLSVLVALGCAMLQNHNRFLIPAAIGLPANAILIIGMLVFSRGFGIYGLGVITVISMVAQTVFLIPSLRKISFRYRPVLDLKDPGLRRVGVLVVPVLIGSSLGQVNTLIDRMLASGLPEGSVSALNFSNKLTLFLVGLLQASILSIYYTSMSKLNAAGETESLKRMLRSTVNTLLVIVIPGSIGFMVLRLPIVQLVFERGLFDRNASEMTSIALFYYAIGLIGYALRDVLSRAFYALQDTRSVMINSAVAVVMNIVVSVSLVPYLGIGGLALGTSVAGIVSIVFLTFRLRKKLGDFGLKNIGVTLLKTAIASVIMGLIVLVTYQTLLSISSSNTLSIITSILVGMALYTLTILAMKIPEVDALSRMITGKIKSILQPGNP